MKVIFIKDLKGQGKKKDIKEVSDGYAQNYLIKNGYAVKYTKTSCKILSEQIDLENKEEEKNINEALEIKKHLENKTLRFIVKSNEGKVFGSISTKQIYEELLKLGFNIDKKKIIIKNPINTLGYHIIKINLHKKVTLDLKVEIVEK